MSTLGEPNVQAVLNANTNQTRVTPRPPSIDEVSDVSDTATDWVEFHSMDHTTTTPLGTLRPLGRASVPQLAQSRLLSRQILRKAVASVDRRRPSFVWSELEKFNACGDPRVGFAWLTRGPCAHHRRVRFSCGEHGFCPSKPTACSQGALHGAGRLFWSWH